MKSPRFHAAVAAALAASLFLAVEPPAAAARGRVQVAPAPAITVDVSRLRELGAGASADLVQRAMLSELASSGLARPGSRLVVRVIGLNINDYAGQTGGAGSGVGGGVNNDYLEAEAVLLGAGGQVLAQIRHVLALPASYGGPYYDPASEQRRVVGLARTFAEWVKRDLG